MKKQTHNFAVNQGGGRQTLAQITGTPNRDGSIQVSGRVSFVDKRKAR